MVMPEIFYANTLEETKDALRRGFEPVEFSFGEESVVGFHKLDHPDYDDNSKTLRSS
jgi:hypothetical protein